MLAWLGYWPNVQRYIKLSRCLSGQDLVMDWVDIEGDKEIQRWPHGSHMPPRLSGATRLKKNSFRGWEWKIMSKILGMKSWR